MQNILRVKKQPSTVIWQKKKKKDNEGSRYMAVATHCQRKNNTFTPVCSKANVEEEGATYIQDSYLASSYFLLNPEASLFLFTCSENHLVSTRYHSSAYSTSISHLVSFYFILNKSSSPLVSSKAPAIFPPTLSYNKLNEDLDHCYLVRHQY